ncbi:MAG: hypothetical protein ACXACX_10900, partial [Candidatus Hodarchaeales archaeon]
MRLVSLVVLIVVSSMMINPIIFLDEDIKTNETSEKEVSIQTISSIEVIAKTSPSEDSIVNTEAKTLVIDEGIITASSNDLPSNRISSYGTGAPNPIPVITPAELVPPAFGTPPAKNITYEEGSTGNSIKWKVNEANPDKYVVYANDTFLNSNSWLTGFVFTNVDGLSFGTWNITVVFNDTSGNILVGERYAFVLDTTSPQIGGPLDLTYVEGTIGNYIEWNATDFNPDNYEIFRDGQSIQTGSWDNPSNISISVDGLQTGVYTYTIDVYDKLGNMISDSVTVTVTDDPNIPSFTLVPSNTTISELSVGNLLTWNASDGNDPDTYVILREHVEIDTGNWTTADNITTNLDSLTLGIYNYTIVLNDSSSNVIQNTVFVTVTDQTNPSIDTSPGNIIYSEDSSSNTLNWSISDLHSNLYEITRDLVIVDSGSWSSGVPIILNIDGLPVGIYSYVITLNDTSGNLATDTLTVEVQDLTDPIFVSSSGNVTYNEGDLNSQLNWNVTDKNVGTYIIYQNGTQVDSGPWTNANNITIIVDGLTTNIYNYTIVVSDLYGNSITDSLYVIVLDVTAPVITISPGNQLYSEGVSLLLVTWTATDTNPTTYEVFNNETIDDGGAWFSGIGEDYNIGGLTKGIYNITIVFYDRGGNIIFDTIWVTVIDDVDPIFTSTPINLDQSVGTTGNTLEWIATDNYPKNYEIFKEEVLNQTGSWTSGIAISINVDGLAEGTYNFTIVIYDLSGNSNIHEIEVNVGAYPSFEEIPQVLTFLNTTSNSLTWVPSDADPDFYSIYRNDTLVINGTWASGSPLTIDITGLLIGTYNFTIYINDTVSNLTQNTIWITITDLPVLQSSPAQTNITISEAAPTNFLNWTATDSVADRYLIYRNGALIFNNTWISGAEVSLALDTLIKGDYAFIIYFLDATNNQINHTVNVSVIDTTAPYFVIGDLPSDDTFEQGIPSQTLSWNSTDNYAGTYIVFKNGSQYNAGIWNNSDFVVVSIDDLTLGYHNLTIQIFDESNNNATHTVWITVSDLTNPTITVPEQNEITYSEGQNGNVLTWTVTDLNAFSYNVTIDTNPYSSGNWTSGDPIVLNIDGLSIGTYIFEFTFYDSNLNGISDSVTIIVIDNVFPILISPGTHEYVEDTTNNKIYWNATDLHPNNYEVYNGSVGQISIGSGTWDSQNLIEINIDGFTYGIYTITLIVFDASGNNATQSIQLTINDIISPTIDPTTTIIFEETDAVKSISWAINDKNPGSFTILENGLPYQSGNWNSSGLITINIGLYPLGTYTYRAMVYDQAGNEAIETTIVIIQDGVVPQFVYTPSNFGYPLGQINNKLNWTADDLHADFYDIFRNGTEVTTNQVWGPGATIEVIVDGLPLGVHNYTIVIVDESGNKNINTVFVSVTDGEIPIINIDPENESYSEGETVVIIRWLLNDDTNGTYQMFINGNTSFSGDWTINSFIDINIGGLVKGTYNITMIFYDDFLNNITSTITVTVIDSTDPIFESSPSDRQIFEGSTGNLLTWDGLDTYPNNYSINIKSTTYDETITGTWTDLITYSFDHLLYGIYNITITINDDSQNFVIHSLLITIIDDTLPILIGELSNITYEVDTQGHVWTINVFDNNPDTYILYIDTVIDDTGIWDKNSPLEFNVDGYQFGEYNYTILIFDASNNVLHLAIIVKVTSPFITETLQPNIDINDIVFPRDLETISNIWLDIDHETVSDANISLVLLDQLNNEIEGTTLKFNTDNFGNFDLLFNYTGIPSGFYRWNVTFTKPGYESSISYIDVEVKKHKYIIELFVPNEIVSGEEFIISVTVSYNNNRGNTSSNFLHLNTFNTAENQSNGFVEGILVNFDIQYIDNNGQLKQIGGNSPTGKNGVAVFELTASTTTELQSIDSIKVSIFESSSNDNVTQSLPDNEMPSKSAGQPDVIQRVNDLIDSYILIVFAGI